MVQIIESNRKPTTGERLQRSLAPVLEQVSNRAREMKMEDFKKKEKESLTRFMQEEYELDTKDLPADFQKEILKGEYANKGKQAGKLSPDEEKKRSGIISKALRGEASKEEIESLPVKDQLDVFKVTKPPREAKKTQASQPIDPEQLAIIDTVRKDPKYQRSTPSQKYQMMTGAGVSRENAKAEAEVFIEEFKSGIEAEERLEKRNYDYHKESKDYDEDLTKKFKSAQREYATIKDLKKKIKNVNPASMSNLLKGFGTIGDKLAKAFLSKDQAAIKAAIPEFLEGKKEIFGVRLSDADLKIVEDKLPDIGNTEEANEMILNMMKKYAEQSMLRFRIGKEIKQKNKGLRPLGYDDMVEERLSDMVAPVEMIKPDGELTEVPSYHVSGAVERGWKVKK